MRGLTDRARIDRVIDAIARAAAIPSRVFLVGGTTAVLIGWRSSTIDVDLVIRPEDDAILRALPQLKEELEVNIELASPLDFIPVPDGWEDRSPLIRRVGQVSFHHFDPYSQALAKLERGHAQDVGDVRELFRAGLVDPLRLREYFDEIEPRLYRFPAVDAPSFRAAVEAMISTG